MNRPLHIWIIFTVCAVVLLGAVTWVTATALRLERAQAEARQQAQFEEKVRLALWRMDSLLAPLVVQESSWPYFAYNSFYPAERAYNRMFNRLEQGDVLIPSPLLTKNSTNVLLHFQLSPDGAFTSPEVPEVPSQWSKGAGVPADIISTNRARLAQLQTLVTPAGLLTACPPATQQNSDASWIAQTPTLTNSIAFLTNALAVNQAVQQPRAQGQQAAQILQNNVELQARANTYQQAFDNYGGNQAKSASTRQTVNEGAMKPIWFGDALVLARRVSVGGRDYIQGCWLDWPNLQRALLENAQDLLPGARLEAVRSVPEDHQARLLAALPVKLVPGATQQLSSAALSPLMLALAAAWACMLLAAIAVGVLLHGAVSLSERRGAFVSAVTHELRTPLTTFKMYSEMLAAGMVRDEAKQKHYLATLCSEANRLSHLVENVLAYARLERGSARARVERISLGHLIERVLPRLKERAERSEMKLIVDAGENAFGTVIHVDAAAVEQILFNLVDNACKYAFGVPPSGGSSGDAALLGPPEGGTPSKDGATLEMNRVIHLEASPDGKFAMLRVRDHGQGISAQGAKRLFKPFSKSAQEAAHSAPGIGLGLALCRRLSRSIGGDLRLVTNVTRGACFELRLPLSTHGDAAALSSI